MYREDVVDQRGQQHRVRVSQREQQELLIRTLAYVPSSPDGARPAVSLGEEMSLALLLGEAVGAAPVP